MITQIRVWPIRPKSWREKKKKKRQQKSRSGHYLIYHSTLALKIGKSPLSNRATKGNTNEKRKTNKIQKFRGPCVCLLSAILFFFCAPNRVDSSCLNSKGGMCCRRQMAPSGDRVRRCHGWIVVNLTHMREQRARERKARNSLSWGVV